MNILITNNHLQNFGGSETFVYFFYRKLKTMGHNVDVFTLNTGDFSKYFSDDLVSFPKNKYDLILVNHNTCLKYLLENKIKGKKIYTCHGVIHGLEKPIMGADVYIGISEEVCSYLTSLGFENNYLIRNGIDTIKFSPTKNISETPKKILAACQGKKAREKIKNVCYNLCIEYFGIEDRIFDVENLYNEVDLVFGLGRTVMEAMACGRNVIVYDERDYMETGYMDGMVTENNVVEIRKNNFSGRRFKFEPTEENIIKEIKKYNKKNGIFNRDYILEENDIINKVIEYLKIYNDLIIKK